MIEVGNIRPPKWPVKVLRFFLKKEYIEEIEGDMEELFYDNVEQLSLKKARRIYNWEMLKLLRPVLLKNFEVIQSINQYDMFKNYFKVSIRGLMKYPMNSFINIFGLAIAIGICVFAYGFTRWTYTTDQFHENKNEVFLTTFFADRDGTVQEFGRTPRPLGEMLRADFTHIKKVCRVEDRNVIVKYEDNVFHERIRFADPEFLEMLTFPLKWGTASSLKDINSIILSEEMSIKYFGEENPIGQSILVKFGKDNSKAFKISGVAVKFPVSHTIDFNFLINFENVKQSDHLYDAHDWAQFVNATLIQVDNPASIKSIEARMGKYRFMQNQAVQNDWAISSFAFRPLATLHEKAGDIRDDISRSSGDNYKSVIFLVIVGVFILALACLNYINIAIVSATKRLKEIGVRKSIGATRKVVITQFLTENIIITFFALIIGIAFGVFVVIPWFEAINDFDMGFTLSDRNLWIYLPAILLLTGIASGAYPAFYVSAFQVVGILKGSVTFGKKNPMTKIFLGFQLVLACILITSGVMFTQNSAYLAKRTWGYNQSEVLYAEVPDQNSFEQLNAVMMRNPDVLLTSGSANHLGKNNSAAVIHMPDREYEVDVLSVDARYLETMGLELRDGRFFNDHEGSDRQAVVINEVMAKNLLWEQPVGKTFQIDSIQYEVIGVLKDFHSYSFYRAIKPTMLKVANKYEYRYLSMKVTEGKENETYSDLQAKWAKLFPEDPFQGGHQEDVWGGYYEAINTHGKVWRAIATITVLLASLGLYGLMTLNTAGRVKEFSIRKVLGAELKNLAANITNQYLILFAVALTIAAPISYSLISWVLTIAYKYHMPMTWFGVIAAVVILLMVLLVTVSTQIRKVLHSNPVNGLKVE